MRLKLLLILLLTSLTVSATAQMGGVKGKVIDRVSRKALEGIEIKISAAGAPIIYTDALGEFNFEGLEPGVYSMEIVGTEWEGMDISVRIGEDGSVRDLGNLSLVSDMSPSAVDDFEIAELESETDDQAMSRSLSASRDVFDNITGYKWGAIRFRARGYDPSTSDVYLNGVYMNDALTGYTPWSLWSGLNDATRNQEITSAATVSDYGVGGINGTTNINARASQVRKGYRFSVVNASGQYRFRAMATYGSGELDSGWSYAFSASTRQGGNDWINGVYYDSWAYFGSVEKKINPFHKVGFTFMGTPGERAVQAGATQEVYDLVNSNMYNPNWGYQGDGTSNSNRRSARIRESHEPIAMLNYFYEPNDRFKLAATASFRFGKNGYSALDWQDAKDPRPDYYRNLPSYFERSGEFDKAELATIAWKTDWNTRQIDWNTMYNVNYENLFGADGMSYWNGLNPSGKRRSKYVIEDRRTDQRDFNADLQITSLVSGRSKIRAGINMRINRTEYYKTIKDLLGGDYFLDIDQFIQRDYPEPGNDKIQSNLYTPNRLVKKGDKYGYDYYAHVHNYKAWLTYNLTLPSGFDLIAAVEGGNSRFWREGRYRKGLFADNSYGESKKSDFWTYTAKLGLAYRITGAQTIYANFTSMRVAPYFRDAFVSPRTRNTVVSDLTTEKRMSVDLNYSLNLPSIKLRVSGYYTKIKDKVKQISFYDDSARPLEESNSTPGMFTNFSMSGIDQAHAGVELGLSVPLGIGLTAEGAVSYGYHKYTSSPTVTQTVDVSEAVILDREPVRWRNMKVEGTPQTAASIGLNYRGPRNIYAGVDLNYYDALYLSMNPLYRTDNAHRGLTAEESKIMGSQEMFRNYFVLNANIGKQWYLRGGYNLGFSLSVNNIINDKEVKTGGFEQMRLRKIALGKEETAANQRYERFDSKYFYMMGTTYYLNIYIRF